MRNGGYAPISVYVSVFLSAMMVGFASATISYDFDVSPSNRKEQPHFYGYIPDRGSRTIIFAVMTLNSALLLLVRSFSAAMLIMVGKRYFIAYMVGDMAIYMLQKRARRDIHYWIPVEGALGTLMSFCCRVIMKLITDFTGVIQFRNAVDLGGMYWTVNMFLALLASWLSVWYYFYSGEDTGTVDDLAVEVDDLAVEVDKSIEEGLAWAIVGGLSGAWAVTFGLFFLLMKKGYSYTFFSMVTGRQATQFQFLKADDGNDVAKKGVINCNKGQWKKEIGGEVEAWVAANWWRWKEEEPHWFTEAWIDKVPEEYIPSEANRAAQEEEREAMRSRNKVGTTSPKALARGFGSPASRSLRGIRATMGGSKGSVIAPEEE